MSLPIMPTRILVVGGGGREHAIVWRLAHEPGINSVVVAPGSDAIAMEPRVRRFRDVDPLDGDAIVRLAGSESVELAVIGPEAPLEAGVADALLAAGVPTFGPSAAAARIETSKAFCHDVAAAAGVRMARAEAFADLAGARAFAAELTDAGEGVVVKADGLAAGKGVTVCDTIEEAELALRRIFDGVEVESGLSRTARTTAETDRPAAESTAPRVVIEERLLGREASLIALCDGRDALAFPAARDHKRLGDGDTGPNTGGMGAYSPVPDLPDSLAEELVDTVHRPLLAELARRGTPFRGALYAGIMLTADGAILLECNARFGDPETQALMPRLAVPLGPLLLAASRGRLHDAARGFGITGSLLPSVPTASVVIVLAASGYPDAPRAGDPIDGLEEAGSHGLVFHAGTALERDHTYLTRGGRVLSVVGQGRDLPAAREAAERAADAISFEGLQRRHDIAAELPPVAAPVPSGARA